MSRPIIESLKTIFIHVPKTAGVSIDRYFRDQCRISGFTGHHPARIINANQPESFQSYFKFAFVRNPWDRLVSAFYFLSQGGYSKIDKVIIEKYINKYNGDFSSFVCDLPNNLHFVHAPENLQEYYADGLPFETAHFIEQNYWVCDHGDKILVDYLGKFETLNHDFKAICAAIGTELVALGPSNISMHENYRSCYTSETAEIVGKLYRKDVEFFGYTF